MIDLTDQHWDYLVVTASNDAQAAAYDGQLRLRRELGLLTGIDNVLVVADPGGRRIGSGGSTIFCLTEVLNRESASGGGDLSDAAVRLELLGRLRILIVHGGGDSRRLPAYGPCGKVFLPLPGASDSAIPTTLFDRQLPIYLALPPGRAAGQVVITSGDVLLSFEAAEVDFSHAGLTGLGCPASPREAAGHGVYCAGDDGLVELFLQKPTPEQQADYGAIGPCGKSILDIGVMSFDAATAVRLLEMCNITGGLDFYREICCALGAKAGIAHYAAAARAGGSALDDAVLKGIFDSLSQIPFHVQVLDGCRFGHFGTTRQIITSGAELVQQDAGPGEQKTHLDINNEIGGKGKIVRADAWVEGNRINAELVLAGRNAVIGADIDEALSLPAGACLDVIAGQDRNGKTVHFIRCYGVDDNFRDTGGQGATLCNMPVAQWLADAGLTREDVWDEQSPPQRRTVWEARVFPAEGEPSAFARWLWMFAPAEADEADRQAYRAADRYSPAEIAALADQSAFHARRLAIRTEQIRRTLSAVFASRSGYSARDLAYALGNAADPVAFVAELLGESHRHFDAEDASGTAGFTFARIIHTLASALLELVCDHDRSLGNVLPGLPEDLTEAHLDWLKELGLDPQGAIAAAWAENAKAAAFDRLGRTIIHSGRREVHRPTSALDSSVTVRAQAPARLDLAGGWTDTPPCSLERGGCVLNATVNLSGEPPVSASLRMIDEPLIRITSEDQHGSVEITELDDLLDYRSLAGKFSLAKAAVALSGFSPATASWPAGATLTDMLKSFGGGIELTTLAAVPRGSGLGTSSIVGATLLAVLHRAAGRQLNRQELFHGVLRLEQALTAGGGWQDQIGGVVGGVKVITTDAGLTPEPSIQPVPADLLDPKANGGLTLLYYTGITRVARNILQQVVGRYLDRDRCAMATLARLGGLVPKVAEAMVDGNLGEFGRLIDTVWQLNKRLDPNSTNDEIDSLLATVKPHIYGAKLLGAGGGGFVLMVCKSPKDAKAVRQLLQAAPINDRARFFDFDINTDGLTVTVS